VVRFDQQIPSELSILSFTCVRYFPLVSDQFVGIGVGILGCVGIALFDRNKTDATSKRYGLPQRQTPFKALQIV
jgi:hypothetical protein